MGRALLKGKGDINEIAEFLTEEMSGNVAHKIHKTIGENEVVLLIFTKHYMRIRGEATLTVLIHQDLDELFVDAIAAGCGNSIGAFLSSAHENFSSKVSKILVQKGFKSCLLKNGGYKDESSINCTR